MHKVYKSFTDTLPKLSTLALLMMTITVFFSISCNTNPLVLTKVVQSDQVIYNFLYDKKGNLSSVNYKDQDIDKSYRENNHIFDNLNRLKYYKSNSGMLYEDFYQYNDIGFLSELTKKRYGGRSPDQLLYVEKRHYRYKDSFLVSIESINNTYLSYDTDYAETYEIFYSDEIFTNLYFRNIMYSLILPIELPVSQINGYGNNNKLIKSVLHTVSDPSSSITTLFNFDYSFDNAQNITEITVRSNSKNRNDSGEDIEPWTLNYKFLYSKPN